MIRIKYSEEVIYDSATQKSGIILVEMENWNEPSNGAMVAKINYLSKDSISGAESLIPGKSKDVQISAEKYNELCLATEDLIPEGLTPYEKRVLRKKMCLLEYVRNDFLEGTTKIIYDTDPEKWELC